MKYCYFVFCSALVFISTLGCGEKLPPGIPRLTPCAITVTMDGKPMPEARVFLRTANENAQSDWSGAGITDSSGVAHLKTNGQYKGVPAGKYKVCIRRIDVTQERGTNSLMNLPPEKRTVIIDLKFDDIEQTPYEIEIVEGKRVSLTCEVTAATDPNLPDDYGRPKMKSRR